MQEGKFYKFARHTDCTCFFCAAPIGSGKPINYGFPRGQFGLWCDVCKLRTYYDTDDQSVKFDQKGDVIPATCSCGCTTPKEQWDTSDGWPRCPECQYI